MLGIILNPMTGGSEPGGRMVAEPTATPDNSVMNWSGSIAGLRYCSDGDDW